MKTKILTLVLSFIGFSAFPQGPTLTMQNSGPQPGDVFISLIADTTGIIIGSSGANHRWDYSNLIIGTLNHEEDYSTDYTANFPGATASYFYTSQMANIIKVDTGAYSILAELDQPVPYMAPLCTMFYSEPQILFTYPINFSNEIINPFAGSNPQYYQGQPTTCRRGISSTNADGWGMLLLPSGIFNNVLRVKIIEDYTDSIVMTNPPSVIINNVHIEKYLWYDGIHRKPLLKIELKPGIQDSIQVIIKSILVAEGINGINNLSDRRIKLNIYPNPTDKQSLLTVTTTEKIDAGFTVLDMTGNEVIKLKPQTFNPGACSVIIDFESLPRGLYFVKCETTMGTVVKKILLR